MIPGFLRISKALLSLTLLAAAIPGAGSEEAPTMQSVVIELSGIIPGGGPVYVGAFDNAAAYRENRPIRGIVVEPSSDRVSVAFDLPPGHYVFSSYQDTNRNGRLDTGFLGIPKEPVGISNYSGKSIPPGFDSLKVELKPGGAAFQPVRIRLVKIGF